MSSHIRVSLALLIPATLAIFMFKGCGVTDANDDAPERIEIRELSTQEKAVVSGSNTFSIELLNTLAAKEPGKSFVASPLSISLAFGMLMNGAEGETLEELMEVFGLAGMTREQVNAAAKSLIPLLTGLDPAAKMRIANSIWVRDGVQIQNAFLNDNRDAYGARIESLDFRDPATVDVINGWVKENTEGLIEEIIQEIPDLAILYLVNAVYFKADWTIQFDPSKTFDEPFLKAGGDWADVPMMRVKEAFRFYEDDTWRAVELPYGGEAYTFVAVQPVDGEDLDTFSVAFGAEDFDAILAGFASDTVQVYLPKFELDHKVEDFKSDLQSMGLNLPFSDQADLTRIHPSLDLYVSDVLHHAVLKVDEEGSEAAAVTSIEIRTTSVGPQEPTIRLDRPFLFFIREVGSGTILFLGRYSG